MENSMEREDIIKNVWDWYGHNFKDKAGTLKISVSDLIADFILGSGYIISLILEVVCY